MIRVVSDDGSANFVSLQAYVFMSNVTRPQSVFPAEGLADACWGEPQVGLEADIQAAMNGTASEW